MREQTADDARDAQGAPAGFGWSDEHGLLRDEARRLLEERCPISEVRRLAEDPLGHDPALWKELAALGWLGLTIPEALGGAGLGSLHLALLLEEMGRCLLPSPYLTHVLGARAIEAAGSRAQQERWLPAIAAGDVLASLALCEPSLSWEPDAVEATALPADGGFVLRGRKVHVQDASSAGLLVAPFREPDGGLALFALELPTAGVTIEPEIGVDPTRRSMRVDLEGVRVGADARLERDGAAALQATFVHGYAALAAEMVGGAEATLEMTRRYAVERKQFGRSIGSFQGVKHPLVDMMVGVELARSHAIAAAAALDHDPTAAETPARMAKALASDVYPQVVRKGVQLHGGYGFTIDCDVHLYFKRALVSRSALGDGVHHRRSLAELLLERD
jgi:alkylation response protein AidB-like acyl-CoA dehydrogenase